LGCYARLGEAARSSCAIEALLSGGITPGITRRPTITHKLHRRIQG